MMEGEEAVVDKTVAFQGHRSGTAYEVILVETEDGWAVMCPALLGCVSQGDSEMDALENIKEAIAGWLKFEARDVKLRTQKWVDEYRGGGFPVKTVTVSVDRMSD